MTCRRNLKWKFLYCARLPKYIIFHSNKLSKQKSSLSAPGSIIWRGFHQSHPWKVNSGLFIPLKAKCQITLDCLLFTNYYQLSCSFSFNDSCQQFMTLNFKFESIEEKFAYILSYFQKIRLQYIALFSQSNSLIFWLYWNSLYLLHQIYEMNLNNSI